MSQTMRLGVAAIVIFLSTVRVSASPDTESGLRRATSIAPQQLAIALQTLAKDRDVQLVYRSELVADRRTDGASGALTLDEALTQLLRGSGLVYRYLGEGAVTLVREE